ncbi:MAG: ABC transporter ATP-binding protein [Blastocatellia bacterium]|nr:ABC transporter ATP-binding protein [Blastocatellia bacterium]MCS7158100.1 ABC transporter ATP-binding protein [Blastocatellia bacterium]MCX7753037.1 ABC transporter ATP-binding protein [Blastocatellia bacterium]MDW8168560.1 ABC transporter ATP-binding protein [Acidobacteriota bacterium]MDW8257277.1 ABC transporter ATP-binding protein [Acidobacteriota bacterium]
MSGPMIEVVDLTKRYDGVLAVDRISFTIARGEIVGYLGPNGAGKSTTVKMLTGILRPTDGTIVIDGLDLLKDPIEVKRRIGYVPETGGVYESLTAYEYLQLVGRLYHLSEEVLDYRIEEFLKLFGLESFMHERLSSYSKGMKQKVLISAALLHNPKVLFLDEPLTGLDAHSALLLKELLRRLAAEGKTIFYCSHILDVVERTCTRVIIIHKGRIVADGTVEQLKELTRQGTLEDIFKQLTYSSDIEEVAEAFARSVLGMEK